MSLLNHLFLGISLVALAAAWSVPALEAQAPGEIRKAMTLRTLKYRTLKEGKNADYIPALAKVDPNLFGIALVTVDGKVYTAGDVKTEVSIQSISKVFTMAQVIQEQGLESIEKQIGVDATGMRFNSIIAVEAVRSGRNRRARDESAGQPGRHLRHQHGSRRERRRGLEEDHRLPQRRAPAVRYRLQDVYKSESDTNQRNQAIGALMLAYGTSNPTGAGGRPLHAAVLDRGERARSGHRWRRRSPSAARTR